MAAFTYPTLSDAIAAGKEVRNAMSSADPSANIGVIANDLWTLQGYAQSMLLGSGKMPSTGNFRVALKTDNELGAERRKAMDALGSFVATADAKMGAKQALREIDFSGVDWNAILSWVMKLLTWWFSQPKSTRKLTP